MIYLLIGIIALSSWWLPWWSFSLWCFIAGLRYQNPFKALFAPAFAASLTWTLVAYYGDLRGFGLISQRLSLVLQLPDPTLSFLLVALLAGVVGAMAGISGYYFRLTWSSIKKTS